ncbi:MAG: hypothetical protein GEV03_01325 [Streptosporangiales bacterium]|nr:hypothetical protein [Streptosporangiales bacterium]
MNDLLRRPAVWAVFTIVLALVLAVALYLFQPWRLFIDRTVDEAAPGAVSTGTAEPAGGARGRQGPRTLATGQLISHEHETSGTVQVLRLEDGSRVLRIEDLRTSDGPDLRVWLSDQPVKEGPAGSRAFRNGESVDLGALKGNQGSQNYPIPTEADLDRLTSMSIWCRAFSVSFGAAELKA